MGKRPRREPRLWARPGKDQLEGRNIVLEALTRKVRPVTRILLDERTRAVLNLVKPGEMILLDKHAGG